MIRLSDDQLNNLNKEALIILVSSLQDQLTSVQEQLDVANARLADNNRQIEVLAEQIRIMNQRRFGRKSESGLSEDDGQMSIFDFFNSAEYLVKDDLKEPEISEVVISSYHRSRPKGKRDVDLDGIPARIIQHELSAEELSRLFPEGYKELPEVVYKRLNIIPETFLVDEHHVHVYASKKNDGRIVKAPRPADLFRDSIATPTLVATVMNAKYTNAMPLDRQVRTFKANGINLSTNTLANWIIKSAENYLSLLYDRLHRHIYDSRVIHADETPVKVMRIDGRNITNGKQTYMWVYRSHPSEGSHPVILYEWQSSRRSDHPREFLKDFSGTVITDGYHPEVLLFQPFPFLVILRDVDPFDLENDRPCAIITAGDHDVVIVGPAFHNGAALQSGVHIPADRIPRFTAEFTIHQMVKVILLWSTLQNKLVSHIEKRT